MKRKLNLLVSGLLLASVAAFVGACSDDETTKKETEATELYFIDSSDELIQKFTITNPADMSTVLNVTEFSGVGLAYDKKNDKIYFSDFYNYYEGKIWTMNAADVETRAAIVENLYDPYSVTIDASAGKIYYADGADLSDEDVTNDASHIYRANLNGSGAEELIEMTGAQFRPLAIDKERNKIYFYDVEAENLYMANLDDGENRQIILEGAWGYAIAVDTENDKIYFDDQNTNDGALMMDDLDGTYPLTPTIVDDTASRIYGIAIDNVSNKLYWSARDNGEIYSADLDGQNKITLKTGLSSPRGLFIK